MLALNGYPPPIATPRSINGEMPASDPNGPASYLSRVLRGGCWYAPPGFFRAACRVGNFPKSRDTGVGFRVVCDDLGVE